MKIPFAPVAPGVPGVPGVVGADVNAIGILDLESVRESEVLDGERPLLLLSLDLSFDSFALFATVEQNNVDNGSIWHCSQVPGLPVHPVSFLDGSAVTGGTVPVFKLAMSRISTLGPGCITGSEPLRMEEF